MSFDCIVCFFMAKRLWLRRDNNIFWAQWSKKSFSLPETQQMLSPVLHTFPAVFLQKMNIDALRKNVLWGALLAHLVERALHALRLSACQRPWINSDLGPFFVSTLSPWFPGYLQLSYQIEAKWPKIIFEKMCWKRHRNTGSLQQWTSDSRFSTETPQ